MEYVNVSRFKLYSSSIFVDIILASKNSKQASEKEKTATVTTRNLILLVIRLIMFCFSLSGVGSTA